MNTYKEKEIIETTTNNKIEIYITPFKTDHDSAEQGIWIDATLEPDKIQDQINKITYSTNYEILAYEGFRTYRVNKDENIHDVHEIALFIVDFPIFGSDLINYHGSVTIAKHAAAEKNYLGCFSSVNDYVEKKLLDKLTPDIRAAYTKCEDIVCALYNQKEIFTISTTPNEVHIFKIIK